jgi:hypothetical protein
MPTLPAEVLRSMAFASEVISKGLEGARDVVNQLLELREQDKGLILANNRWILMTKVQPLQKDVTAALEAAQQLYQYQMRLQDAFAQVDASFQIPSEYDRQLRAITDAYVETMRSLLHQFAPQLDQIQISAAEIGSEAAHQTITSLRWATAIGDRLDTTMVSQLLGISRQALGKRVAKGSLITIPGNGTSWFPAWQFDRERRSIRPEVLGIVLAFRRILGDVDPLLIASWATTSQDDLEGASPAQWLARNGEPRRVLEAASRAASHLAQ